MSGAMFFLRSHLNFDADARRRRSDGCFCAQSDLEKLGFKPDESLVVVTKKLVCSGCQSRAVRAFRYIDDELQPVFPIAPK